MISTLFRTLFSVLGTHRKLALENLALRQQIVVLRRSVKRPDLAAGNVLYINVSTADCTSTAGPPPAPTGLHRTDNENGTP